MFTGVVIKNHTLWQSNTSGPWIFLPKCLCASQAGEGGRNTTPVGDQLEEKTCNPQNKELFAPKGKGRRQNSIRVQGEDVRSPEPVRRMSQTLPSNKRSNTQQSLKRS